MGGRGLGLLTWAPVDVEWRLEKSGGLGGLTQSTWPYHALLAEVRAAVGPELLPGAEGIGIGGGAVAEPGVELGGLFQLLAAAAGDGDEAAVQFGEGGHIAP